MHTSVHTEALSTGIEVEVVLPEGSKQCLSILENEQALTRRKTF